MLDKVVGRVIWTGGPLTSGEPGGSVRILCTSGSWVRFVGKKSSASKLRTAGTGGWLDDCLMEQSCEALKRSLELLKRTERTARQSN